MYRTIYAAEQRRTALREVLQDLRPNVKLRAEFEELFGKTHDFVVAGTVPWKWRAEHVLAPAHVEVSARIADLDDIDLRRELETIHAKLLVRLGMAHIDLSEARSKVRELTQTISQTLHEDGCAGILFRSNVDDGVCVAIFEGRGRLEPAGDVDPLTSDLPEMLDVCSEFGLVLRRNALPASVVAGKRGSRLAAFMLRLAGRG